jgi:hypothetical protein
LQLAGGAIQLVPRKGHGLFQFSNHAFGLGVAKRLKFAGQVIAKGVGQGDGPWPRRLPHRQVHHFRLAEFLSFRRGDLDNLDGPLQIALTGPGQLQRGKSHFR